MLRMEELRRRQWGDVLQAMQRCLSRYAVNRAEEKTTLTQIVGRQVRFSEESCCTEMLMDNGSEIVALILEKR